MNIVYAENKKSNPQILGFVWQQISEIQSTFESLFSQIKTWDYSDKIYRLWHIIINSCTEF